MAERSPAVYLLEQTAAGYDRRVGETDAVPVDELQSYEALLEDIADITPNAGGGATLSREQLARITINTYRLARFITAEGVDTVQATIDQARRVEAFTKAELEEYLEHEDEDQQLAEVIEELLLNSDRKYAKNLAEGAIRDAPYEPGGTKTDAADPEYFDRFAQQTADIRDQQLPTEAKHTPSDTDELVPAQAHLLRDLEISALYNETITLTAAQLYRLQEGTRYLCGAAIDLMRAQDVLDRHHPWKKEELDRALRTATVTKTIFGEAYQGRQGLRRLLIAAVRSLLQEHPTEQRMALLQKILDIQRG